VKVAYSVTVLVDAPDALIMRARARYADTVVEIDVTALTDEEALAVADLTVAEQHAHPNAVTVEAAIPDLPAAVAFLVEEALRSFGADPEESSVSEITDEPHRARQLRASTSARPNRTPVHGREARPSRRRRQGR
jgi:hypothetical protein